MTSKRTISLQSAVPDWSEPVVFVGALSFEQRCVAAARAIAQQGTTSKAFLVNYHTSVRPASEGDFLRRKHERMLRDYLEGVETAEVPPYAVRPFIDAVSPLFADTTRPLVIDTTCLTRAHTLALGTLVASASQDLDVRFAYTTPLAYAAPSGRPIGWKDVIVLPIGKTPRLKREGHALGLVIAGHEADRLSVAFNALEPAAGLIVIADTPGRPDFRQRCEQAHVASFRRLERLRMPMSEPRHSIAEGWVRRSVGLADFDSLAGLVREQIGKATNVSAPMIVYPFGPKTHVVAVGVQLAVEYGGASWAVYPVPTAYNVDYSIGIGSTFWMHLKWESDRLF